MTSTAQTEAPPGAFSSVLSWRREQLEAAGYPLEEARLLAERTDVDLHRAADLLRSGCPRELALRILL